MAAAVSAPGIGSGLDVQGIVKALVEADSQPLNNLQKQQEQTDARISAHGTLNSALTEYQNTMRDLYSGATVPLTVQSSDDKVATAEVSRAATPGQYEVVVEQEAIQQQLRSKEAFRSPDAKVGSGMLRIDVGGKKFNVRIKRGDNTLAGIADAINTSPDNPGVSASVVTGQDGARLVLTVNDRFTRSQSLADRLPAFIKTDGRLATTLQSLEQGYENLANRLFPKKTGGLGDNFPKKLADRLQQPSRLSESLQDGGRLMAQRQNRLDRLAQKDRGSRRQERLGQRLEQATTRRDTVAQQWENLRQQAVAPLLKNNDAVAPQLTVRAIGPRLSNALSRMDVVRQPQKAIVTIDGVRVESDGNTITNGVSGLTINVKAPGKTTITVTGNSKVIEDSAKKFVDAYNKLQQEINKTKGELGGGYDTTLTSIENSLRTVLNTPPPADNPSPVQNLTSRLPENLQDRLPPVLQTGFSPRPRQNEGGQYKLPAEVGIILEKDGSMSLDNQKLDAALGKDFQSVSQILTSATGQSAPYRMNEAVMNLTATEGALGSRTKSLQDEKTRIQDQILTEQERVKQAEEQYYQQFAQLDQTVAAMQQSGNAIAALGGQTATNGNAATSLLPS